MLAGKVNATAKAKAKGKAKKKEAKAKAKEEKAKKKEAKAKAAEEEAKAKLESGGRGKEPAIDFGCLLQNMPAILGGTFAPIAIMRITVPCATHHPPSTTPAALKEHELSGFEAAFAMHGEGRL